MVYTSDLTFRKVSLILINNKQKNEDHLKTYFDKIEEPLTLFYSDKQYEIVLWAGLKKRVYDFYSNTSDGGAYVTFITSQSRFKDLLDLGLPVERLSENQDYVLGRISK
jgi:hypothetical protein